MGLERLKISIILLLLGNFLSHCGRGPGFDIRVENSEVYLDQPNQNNESNEPLSNDASSEAPQQQNKKSEGNDREKHSDEYRPKDKLNWGYDMTLFCLIDQYTGDDLLVLCGFQKFDSDNFEAIPANIRIEWNITSEEKQGYPVTFQQQENLFQFTIKPHVVESTTIRYLISHPAQEGTLLGKSELSSYIKIPEAHFVRWE